MAMMPSTPPGTATTTATSDASAPSAIITNCTTSVHTTDVIPPIHVQPMPMSVSSMIAGTAPMFVIASRTMAARKSRAPCPSTTPMRKMTDAPRTTPAPSRRPMNSYGL